MLASLLRRPLVLLLVLALVAVAGGIIMRAQQKAAMAAMFPLATPEAQQAAQQQMSQALTQLTQETEAARQAAMANNPGLVSSPYPTAYPSPYQSPSYPAQPYPTQSNPAQFNPSDPMQQGGAASLNSGMATSAASATSANGPQIIGIPSEALDFTYSTQANSQWCWAASIQMTLQYHGIKALQQDIVARTFGPDANGQLPNRPGDLGAITANLNNMSVDRAGTAYRVHAEFGEGAPPVPLLLDELSRREPIIIGYSSGPNSGHAVVITGARYQMTPQGPQVLTIIVRDPWPSEENRKTNGRVEYEAGAFAPKIHGYWRIRVRQ